MDSRNRRARAGRESWQRMARKQSLLTRTFADLRRRRVFRVAAAYGVAAWLVVEVCSVIVPALHLPEWTLTAVVIAALAGFPVTLLMAWLYDLTADGLVRTAPAEKGHQEIRRVARRGIDFVIIGVLLAIIGYLVYRPDLFGPEGQPDQSIAVLPFVDLSPDGDNEYFSDGISEELLNSLVGIDGLRVAARTSSFAFKERNEDIRSIGEKLNVSTVLEGSVRRAGDQLRITAQLINVEDGFHLWSETYDRRLDDIFSIQAEIAHSIVEALRLELIGDQQLADMTTPGVDIRAYDLYLLGRHRWHERTAESLRQALDLFQEAVEIDEDFALAYTGLADTYLLLDGYGDLTTEEASARAELPVARALALDDTLAEAYASLGLLRFNQGDLTAGELALRKAITLNDNYSMAHMWLGLVLDRIAGPAAALREYRKAQEIDPLHPVINSNLAHALGATGHYEEAVASLTETVAANPESDVASFKLSRLHADFGRLDESVRVAIEELQDANRPLGHLALAMSLITLGDFERAAIHLDSAEQALSHTKRDVLEARAWMLLSQGRFEALAALFSDMPSDLSRDQLEADPERVGPLIWSGIAALYNGRPGDAAVRLARGRDFLESHGATPAELVPLYTAIVLAQEAEGQTSAAAASRRDALTFVVEAESRGWRLPAFQAWSAVLLHMDGQRNEAMHRMRTAVDSGWRAYWQIAWHPETGEWLEDTEFQGLIDEVRSDLERMRAEVLPLLNAESARLAGTR
jgi:TolB-like protein/Flp pilus assembly protein TadD